MKLRKNEKEVWSSAVGKNIRVFSAIRDLGAGLISGIAVYWLLNKVVDEKISLVVAIIPFVMFFIFFLINQINFMLVRYTLTTDRVTIRKGIVRREFKSISLDNIIDTEVRQTILDRIINSGSIYFFTANDSQSAEDEKTTSFISIDNPFRIHNLFLEVREGSEDDIEDEH